MKNGSHFSIFFSGIPTGLLPEIFIAKIYFLWEIRYNSDIDFHTAICAAGVTKQPLSQNQI